MPSRPLCKILLLQPPVQDFYETAVRLQPTGLCYLKAAVRRFLPGAEVVVRDYHQGWGRRTIPLPPELADLREYYLWPDRSPFSTFHAYYHFGAAFEAVGESVARETPDLVGISCLFSPYYREVLRCAEEIKRRHPVPIVVGGAHASAAPQSLLAHGAVDYVIRGEGERPLVELVRALRSSSPLTGVPNLAFRLDGAMVLNPVEENFPLEDLPSPDLSDLPVGRYRWRGRPLSTLVTSRGCPRRCSFCSVHATFGDRYRRRAPEAVLDEIRVLYGEGYRAFDFEDDNLTFHLEETKALCRGVIASFPAGELALTAMNGVSYESLDLELLQLMRRAGFRDLNLSLVSSRPSSRSSVSRPHAGDRYCSVVREAAALGFGIVSYQILGLPGEDLDSMAETLAISARLPVLLGASPFYLAPGSPLAASSPVQTERDLVRARLTALGHGADGAARDQIYTLFVTTRILNFLKGLRVERPETPLSEALDAAREGGERLRVGAAYLERLLTEKRLFACTADGPRLLPRFDAGLFLHVWGKVERIATQNGKSILLPHGPV